MNSVGTSRRPSKRNARDSPRPKMTREFDLNSPPVEVVSEQWAAPPSNNPGVTMSPIDLDAVDDDVQMLYSLPEGSETRNLFTRNQPTFVVVDEDVDVTPAPPVYDVEEPSTTLTLFTHNRYKRILPNDNVINCDLFDKGKDAVKPAIIPEPIPAAPKEPKFSCPICMKELVEPCSTKCGHIFCKECIRASIKAQKKCPTCRKKITMSSFHRVYLPAAE